MRLTNDKVALIRASQGVYQAQDVAQAYNVHPSTVNRIWRGMTHKGIKQAPEPPNISTKPRPRELVEEINYYLYRGLSPMEVAEELGISVSSVYMYRGVFV